MDGAPSVEAGRIVVGMAGSAKTVCKEEKKAIWQAIEDGNDAAADPRYGAARLWLDAIIDPSKTREVLLALEPCALNTEPGRFNVGVMPT